MIVSGWQFLNYAVIIIIIGSNRISFKNVSQLCYVACNPMHLNVTALLNELNKRRIFGNINAIYINKYENFLSPLSICSSFI